jgi:2-hydroxychromene-2-carboxylate isomerase
MRHTVDYFFAPNSPWTYLGHARFSRLIKASGAQLRVLPVDLGDVFSVSGGLPLPKRAPQRQAYRLLELKRFSAVLGVPLNVQPRFFPVAADDAARLIVAADQAHGSAAAMTLAGALGAAVWAQERNIADAATLTQLLMESGLGADLLQRAHDKAVQSRYAENTQAAKDAGVFGAPSYVVDGELFWGQDRLDFVERQLGLQGQI